ncbi:MAG: hypothetical protein ACRDKW_07745 [Actinomycetota bacterium]
MSHWTAWASARLACALVERGDVGRAEEVLADAFAGPVVTSLMARHARARVLAARGSPDARPYAEDSRALLEESGYLIGVRALDELLATMP